MAMRRDPWPILLNRRSNTSTNSTSTTNTTNTDAAAAVGTIQFQTLVAEPM
jgi:hypothetical protein